MENMEELLKVLSATQIFLKETSTCKKNNTQLEKLIKALESKKHIDLDSIIRAIEAVDGKTVKRSKGISTEALNKIYAKLYKGQLLSRQEEIAKKMYSKDAEVMKLLNCTENEMLGYITSKTKDTYPIDVLKIVAYARMGMDIKGRVSKNNVIDEIRLCISQKKYYENMSSAYKGTC